MKKLFCIFTVVLLTFTLPLYAAENRADLLDRFENALLDVMANFEVAHDGAGITSETRKLYDKSLSELQATSAALQKAVDGLGLGSDINPDQHVKQVNEAFRSLNGKSVLNLATTTKNGSKNNDRQSDDKLRNIGTISGANSMANRAGLAFRNLSNDLQALRELDFHAEDGRYVIAPQKRQLLPYLEFQRDYLYFRMSYPHMIDLCNDRTWVNDMEKRLLRMRSLSATIQPVFRAYCPDEAAKVSLAAESERLMKVCQAISREASRISQNNTLGLNTILDNSKIGAKTTSTINFKSSSLNDAQKNMNKEKQTTAAVEDTSEEYKKNAEKAFSNFLTYFEAMSEVDWDVYAFSATKAKKTPEVTPAKTTSTGKKSTGKTATAEKNPDVVEITEDTELQWK